MQKYKFSISTHDAALINDAFYKEVIAAGTRYRLECVAQAGITEWSFDQAGWALEVLDAAASAGGEYAEAYAQMACVIDEVINMNDDHCEGRVYGLSV